ncbi:MAG: response regulator [Methylococcaceae bacterium]
MANILVVDDDEQYPIMLAKMLRNNQHNVTIANDGAEALKLCATQKFDLIVTDILMPNVDGIDLILDLIGMNSKVPIIAISGGRNTIMAEFSLQSAQTLGVFTTLKKPFTDEQLIKAVNDALNSSKTS